MVEQTVIEQLNNFAKEPHYNGVSLPFSVDFCVGEGVLLVSELAKKYAPYGKVAILYFKNQYSLLGENIANALKANGNKPLHLVVPDSFCDRVENYSQLFTLPEDIRFVICTDNRLINATKYYSNFCKIHSAYIIQTFDMIGALMPTINIKNGKKSDTVAFEGDMHVVLDDKKIFQDRQGLANAYAFVCANSLALIDYRINASLLNKKINKSVYQLISGAVVKAYPLFSYNKDVQPSVILESFIKVELANAFTGGEIYNNFSCLWVARVLGEKDVGCNTLACSIYTAKVYSLYFSGDYDSVLYYPNYNQRADFLSELLGCEEEVLQKITSNSTFFDKKDAKIKELVSKLSKDLNSFIECYDFMKGAVNALGANCFVQGEKVAPYIKHSGDLMVNGMTLARDGGITEAI